VGGPRSDLVEREERLLLHDAGGRLEETVLAARGGTQLHARLDRVERVTDRATQHTWRTGMRQENATDGTGVTCFMFVDIK
jgi:hypothetical protein